MNERNIVVTQQVQKRFDPALLCVHQHTNINTLINPNTRIISQWNVIEIQLCYSTTYRGICSL